MDYSGLPKPKEILMKRLPSGNGLIRFSSIHDIFWFDEPANSPNSIRVRYGEPTPKSYKENRLSITPEKKKIIERARQEMSTDKEFLEIVYKGKSDKRQFTREKFGGQLNMVAYARGEEKLFKRMRPGAKKQTLNMAFQVGTFVGGNYTESFVNILKTVLMCQAMGIALNIDMFDSEQEGPIIPDVGESVQDVIQKHGQRATRTCYTLCNVASSSEKINFNKLLSASHREFFNHTLFNSYAAAGTYYDIARFAGADTIKRDLSPHYDIIGGNMLPSLSEKDEATDGMVSKIMKIGLKKQM